MKDIKLLHGGVLVIGGSNIDLQGRSLAPFVPGDSNPGRIVRAFGGVGRNIAENCVLLGLPTALLTAFGDDEDGRLLEEDCAAKGIDASMSLRAGAPTARYLCAIDADGSLVAAVADMAVMELIGPEYLESRRPILDAAGCIVADANLPRRSLEWLASRYGRKARKAWKADVLDSASPAGIRPFPLLFLDTVSSAKAARAIGLSGEFDCAKPNLAEAAVLAGTGEAGAEELCASLTAKGGMPSELYISLGGKGMYYYTSEGEEGHVSLPAPGSRPEPVNRSGAGDAACAALVWATMRACPAREKARYALTAAMLASASPEPVARGLSPSSLMGSARLMFPEE